MNVNNLTPEDIAAMHHSEGTTECYAGGYNRCKAWLKLPENNPECVVDDKIVVPLSMAVIKSYFTFKTRVSVYCKCLNL